MNTVVTSETARASLRAATPDDREFLLALFATTRPDLALLPAQQRDQLVEMQFVAQDRQYRQANPGATFDVIEIGATPAGRWYVDRRPEELHLIDVSLLPEHRGAGIGTALVEALQEEAAASGRAVTLHVARDNRAAALYQRLGFRITGDLGVYRRLEWRAP